MICSVCLETASVEFIAGYAGVMIGATCLAAPAWNADHTGRPRSASWGFVSMTGLGHLHDLNTRKNLRRREAAQVLGYSCTTSATEMFMLTPPQYPILLLYRPRALAHLRTHLTTARNVLYRSGVPDAKAAIRFVTLGPFRLFSVAESTPSRTASLSMSSVGGTELEFSLAKSRSMLTPSQSKVRMGTAAPSTGTKFVTSGWRLIRSASESGSLRLASSDSSPSKPGGT
mmetsp:Transcript_57478/g.171485  ORF Transcript_57478/g.171485 Transcript_57478/m.171485 type:complete len:229 (+) Transcript_57478:1694-2380(+)